MSSKLKVEELRTLLAQRGLDTTGTKLVLCQRLESAYRDDKKTGDGSSSVVVGKKRPRDQTNGNSSDSGKVDSVEAIRDMGIRQLREQAALRGLPTGGSKRELVERICAAIEVGPDAAPEDKEVDKAKKEKLVTATKKGGALLDQWLPDHIKSNYHVLQHDGEIYDAMLNQTNVGENNNKFYVIQALESDDGGTFMVYHRWGRVGVKGQDKLQGPYTHRDLAISAFGKKFFEKTKNHWSDRKEFICKNCYTWLEMDYTETEKEAAVPLWRFGAGSNPFMWWAHHSWQPDYKVHNKPKDSIIGSQPRETQLESHLAKFISLICNVSMMKQQMSEIGYNAEKLPLGKLSKSTILKGYEVLKRISDVIGQSDRKKLELLSGEFYTVIPHDFGFKKMLDFVIDTPSKLKSKLEMVEALGEIEVASKLLKDDIDQDDPLYSHYERLHCELIPLEVDSKEFSMIQSYMQNTHAKTHSNYTVDIVQIFKVSRRGESERFRKFASIKNRMLLWHGSRLTNWTGILSQGLRIAPPEAPSTGYMFGKGVYFADMFSKSANYCFSTQTSTAGVLLLCEVALGDMAELLSANYEADKLPKGKLSTKGVGATAPDSSEFETLEDGIIVPLGKPKEQSVPKCSLRYNEYIVYNVEQIRMRYVVQVNFNYK